MKTVSLTGKRKPLGADAENIDPKFNLSLKASAKRKRSEADENDENENTENQDPGMSEKSSKPAKASRFAMKTITPRILSQKPKPAVPVATATVSPTKPAGRSPQASPSKSACKPFARRSNVSKTRPELASRKGVSRPFSIAAALSGKTKAAAPAPAPAVVAPAPKKETPASWNFEIHVDSEEEEMTNLMQHSTGVLNISDERSTRSRASSIRGKENVPPSELGLVLPAAAPVAAAAVTAAVATQETMEEDRAPLGELNAADYYGADCHAFSYAVVYDDENENEEVEVPKPVLPRSKPVRHSKLSSVSSISSILEATAPAPVPEADAVPETDTGKIDIWESESAAEETQ